LDEGLVFRVVLVAYFVLYVGVRAYYRARTGTLNEKPTPVEGIIPALRVILRVPWMALMLVWMIAPAWLQWSSAAAPQALSWLGVGFMGVSLMLLTWVHHTLGDNFSPTLKVKEGQTLVTGGPYRLVRHPMYAAVFLSVIGVCLITANWLIILISIPGIAPAMAKRMEMEEAMMVEKFGDRYRVYMQSTGRVLPKIRMKVVG
jgi:protein-S-isoprenylcysteine O-methyltransferase Ste14